MPSCILKISTEALRSRFALAAKIAINGSGASDVVFTERYSEAVDKIIASMPAEMRDGALDIAKSCGEYATPEQRKATQDALAENGDCRHGLDFMTCPAGCFE